MEEGKRHTFPEEEYEEISQVPLEEEGAGERRPRSRRKGSRPTGRTAGQARPKSTSYAPEELHGAKEKKREERRRGQQGGRSSLLAVVLALILGAGCGLGGGYWMWGYERANTVDLKAVEVPKWVKQEFIRKNIFSRPDVSRREVSNIVIHYVANPGSTAAQNRAYFDSLADQDPGGAGASASAHFVVGLEGEVIQCIPVTEIAYANAPRNNDTISIETCHPDESGKFNEATYDSLVKLTACLCRELKLTSKDVIRHYDVNEKNCPKYYVEHEDAWEQFKKDVNEAIKARSWEQGE